MDLQIPAAGQCWEIGDLRILMEKMAPIGREIEELTTALSSAGLGDVSDFSAEWVAWGVKQWFLEKRNEDTQ